jgi:hypothetical protein
VHGEEDWLKSLHAMQADGEAAWESPEELRRELEALRAEKVEYQQEVASLQAMLDQASQGMKNAGEENVEAHESGNVSMGAATEVEGHAIRQVVDEASRQEAEEAFRALARLHSDGSKETVSKAELVEAMGGDYGLFKKLDADESGEVTLREFQDFVVKTWVEKGEKKAAKWLHSLCHTLTKHTTEVEKEKEKSQQGVTETERGEEGAQGSALSGRTKSVQEEVDSAFSSFERGAGQVAATDACPRETDTEEVAEAEVLAAVLAEVNGENLLHKLQQEPHSRSRSRSRSLCGSPDRQRGESRSRLKPWSRRRPKWRNSGSNCRRCSNTCVVGDWRSSEGRWRLGRWRCPCCKRWWRGRPGW